VLQRKAVSDQVMCERFFYPSIIGDIGERLTYSYVEFKDGEKVDINNLEYRLIKQLIWW